MAEQPVLAGGRTIIKAAALVVTASSAYTSGNVVGSKLVFADIARYGHGGLIQQVTLFSKSAQTGAFDLLLFHADPSASTFTDKTALALAAADYDKLIGVVALTAWTSLGTPSIAQALGVAMPFDLNSASENTTMYGVLVARSTPTFVSTSDLKVALKNLSD